jgi:FdhD protein
MTGTIDEREVARVPVERVNGECLARSSDELSVEEPLEIRISVIEAGRRQRFTLAVTMRTPGNDAELAAGFLLTEGIVAEPDDLIDVEVDSPNLVTACLRRQRASLQAVTARHSFISSSCGVCGKRSIAAVRVARRRRIAAGAPRLALDVIHALPDAARAGQGGFSRTGGIHASALFDAGGQLLGLREDVGRHNALDKLLGAEFLAGRMPLAGGLVFLSGRVSFELVQKAAIAGVPIIAAVGAPSSLAVELARDCGMTLLGFVRDGRFNVYHDAGRLDCPIIPSSQRP